MKQGFINDDYCRQWCTLSFGLPSRILHADGYVDVSGQMPVFYYHLKDHLGNVRSVITPGTGNQPEIVQAMEYFPFGMSFESSIPYESEQSHMPNKHKYNSKLRRSRNPDTSGEEQEMPGRWLDYGARFYDSQLGRWHSVDPLAEKNHIQSLYVYAANNPILFIDWLGLDPVYNWDKGRYEDNGKEVDWNYVSNWITDNNGGIELWNSETGLQTDNFSSAFGFYNGIPFAELGFGNVDERQYVRTYLVGESNMGAAFGNNSPFSQSEQKDIFLQYVNIQTSKTSKAVLGLTLGIPVAIIGGAELVMASPFIYSKMNMLLNAAGHEGAKACIAGNQAMYQAWTWLNYSNTGAWVGAVGSAVAPEGLGMPYRVNPMKETVAKSVKFLIDIFNNERKK